MNFHREKKKQFASKFELEYITLIFISGQF